MWTPSKPAAAALPAASPNERTNASMPPGQLLPDGRRTWHWPPATGATGLIPETLVWLPQCRVGRRFLAGVMHRAGGPPQTGNHAIVMDPGLVGTGLPAGIHIHVPGEDQARAPFGKPAVQVHIGVGHRTLRRGHGLRRGCPHQTVGHHDRTDPAGCRYRGCGSCRSSVAGDSIDGPLPVVQGQVTNASRGLWLVTVHHIVPSTGARARPSATDQALDLSMRSHALDTVPRHD